MLCIRPREDRVTSASMVVSCVDSAATFPISERMGVASGIGVITSNGAPMMCKKTCQVVTLYKFGMSSGKSK